ncbi:feruloyl-CoA synthase [Ferrovibrio terrae]|uniref:Feruloyl-CoA synthase n=1 Tax=Ferrovibrio terrae TaxID=2594003 RepID=A0A516H2D9_9PROT|nr:feruloyl-CoA synthase [Ferrovibrio terrae]QDO97939.1 feruloyl-CoA synthase [Ferrovibrio terrae]
MSSHPHRQVNYGRADTELTRLQDGTILMRSPEPLDAYPEKLTEKIDHWGKAAPERTFMAQRDAKSEWRRLSYADLQRQVRAIGQALLDRKLSAERPIAILSDNDLEHVLLALAAQYVGVPSAAISPAYSLVSSDHAKLKHVLGLLNPGLVFAADGARYATAINAAVPVDTEVVVTANPLAGRAATAFDALLKVAVTADVDRAHAAITPDTVAKFLFTSGSTGMPKGVINTQRMLCSNQQMILQSLPVFGEEPPVFIDWLPWNHTFGGNHNIGITLYNGGSLYIDDGKPVPALVERTVRNLREIAPTVYFNVPKGFEMLVPYLREDKALRETFFSKLKMIFFSGAALPQHVWTALEELAVETIGVRIPIVSGLGATETAPFALCANWPVDRSGIIGLPVPGQELKLVPNGGKLEVRVRGPNITPGYWRMPEISAKSFDDEGYYKMGDAARFIDPDRPEKGLMFDGRISEDFKLTSGTWVSVGPLRARFIAHFAPYVRDVVIAGHDRSDLAGLVIVDLDNCRALCPDLAPDAGIAQIVHDSRVRARFKELVESYSQQATGSSTRIERIVLLDEMPSLDVGEVTDKGSINQRAVLDHRAALVEDLYAATPSSRVITAKESIAHVA